ncbi:claudin-34-like [Nelusetta ayraudi]|uniref:claudin-34-like n=1 Tax=Nelusetta ayraudi TaxID=303726 RepID=UPI003F724070
MAYLAHSAHAQMGALPLGCVGWTLTCMSLGLIQWRVWLVEGSQVVHSGVAWVGLWRACFHSYALSNPGFLHCGSISLLGNYAPPEIAAGQVLMVLAVVGGLLANASGVYAVRNAYFGVERTLLVRRAFHGTGALGLLAAAASSVPLLWNLGSVVTNQTISFPPDFRLPPAPRSQYVGGGIGVGLVGTALMVVHGIVFCCYRLPAEIHRRVRVPGGQGAPWSTTGKENLAFESDEHMHDWLH